MADIRINSLPSTATSFNTDDYIAIDGASAGTRRMLAANPPFSDVTLGSSGPSVKSSLSARAPRQGLVFDGSAGATVSGVAAFGSSDFSVAAWINQTSAANAQIVGASTNGFVLYLRSTGKMLVLKQDTGGTSDSTGSVTAGKTTLVVYTKSGTTGTFYFNGIAGGTVTDNFNYTVAFSTVGKSGSNAEILNGLCIPFAYNRALSASEVVALYEAGAPAGADYNSASNTAINTSAFTNDGTFGLNYSTFSGASATGFTAAQATATAGMGEMKPNLSAKVGKRYRVSFTATLTSGQAPTFQTQDSSGNLCFPQVTVTNGANSFEVTMNSFASGTLVTSFYTSNVTSYAISNFSMVPLGLLLAPDAAQAGGGLVWYDTSGNAANITLPASGVSWNVPSSLILGGKWTVATPVDTTGMFNLLPSGGDYFALTLNNRSSGAAAASRRWIIGNNWNNNGDLSFLQSTSSTSTSYNTMGTFAASGNFLVGTTTDAGYTITARATDASIAAMSADTSSQIRLNAQSGIAILETVTNTPLRFRTNSTEAMRLFANGNVFVGASPVDGGQKLQVSGDIAVGTGNPFSLAATKFSFSSSTNYASMAISGGTGTGASIEIGDGSSRRAQIVGELDGSGTNGKMILRTFSSSTGNVATALTLDSSQNATFAGQVNVNKAANGYDTVKLTGASGNHVGTQFVQTSVATWSLYNTATTGNLSLNNGGLDALVLAKTTGDATFAGTVSLSTTSDKAGLTLNFPAVITGSNGPAMTFKSWTNSASLINSGRIASTITDGSASYGSKLELSVASSGSLTTAFTILQDLSSTAAGTLVANKSTTAFRIPNAETPASASATGSVGTITWDASYIYVCTAANTWKRVAIATWP